MKKTELNEKKARYIAKVAKVMFDDEDIARALFLYYIALKVKNIDENSGYRILGELVKECHDFLDTIIENQDVIFQKDEDEDYDL